MFLFSYGKDNKYANVWSSKENAKNFINNYGRLVYKTEMEEKPVMTLFYTEKGNKKIYYLVDMYETKYYVGTLYKKFNPVLALFGKYGKMHWSAKIQFFIEYMMEKNDEAGW